MKTEITCVFAITGLSLDISLEILLSLKSSDVDSYPHIRPTLLYPLAYLMLFQQRYIVSASGLSLLSQSVKHAGFRTVVTLTHPVSTATSSLSHLNYPFEVTQSVETPVKGSSMIDFEPTFDDIPSQRSQIVGKSYSLPNSVM